jgi:hypothetical protein
MILVVGGAMAVAGCAAMPTRILDLWTHWRSIQVACL